MVSLAFGIVDQQSVVLASVLAAAGLLLIAAGWFGLIPALNVKDVDLSGPGAVGIHILSAVALAAVMFLVSAWPILAFFGALGGWFAPTFKGSKRKRREAIARVDAIATWVENLRDNISGSAGLQQALRMSGDHAPEPIRREVRDLVLRLQHEPVTDSLRRFAADVAHPTADMAVACLVLASTRSAGSLANVLARTAQAARDSAAMMRQVDAGRASVQSQAKTVTIIISLVAGWMITSQREFMDPYDSFVGQIALAAVCSMFAISAFLLYRLSKLNEPDRVFRGIEAPQVDADAADAAELVEVV